eukprot:CAMPEP_0182439410 /NCGR_PEP_ID=MMETSP1167-20130531/86423_1 /TAXON_ID=2988 /ORGANISM="Mallomonas Sp, Strain CCMP3275" /LENGTH=120 /DNA_ID=CAMNT_0024633111 /DNA_START=680 /DNA_END=1042 /DNA_ORIENTATION=+
MCSSVATRDFSDEDLCVELGLHLHLYGGDMSVLRTQSCWLIWRACNKSLISLVSPSKHKPNDYQPSFRLNALERHRNAHTPLGLIDEHSSTGCPLGVTDKAVEEKKPRADETDRKPDKSH